MKFSGREDVEAPIAAVWAALSDFNGLELLAQRKGVEVARTGVLPGLSWKVAFQMRGKRRQLQMRLTRFEEPAVLAVEFSSAPAEGSGTLELVPLGPNRTRLLVSCEVKPRTLAARVFIQSLKLARGRVNRRFNQRLSQLARVIEGRTRASS